ncbi:DUF397 domain-containing protein [Streptomyces sp. NPDC127074]|uniref:DUF397 domain-containing protein n=1 Tax=Streptomyces sp. NPDC127074 TaxID=3347130 RepID=UPI003649E9EE
MATRDWQKSSYSSTGNACLYTSTPDNATIRLRESDEADTILTVTPTALLDNGLAFKAVLIP